jgi:hypothetical protein
MWIVGVGVRFYPSINTFADYKDAKEYYDSLEVDDCEPISVYLAEVKEYKKSDFKY